MNGLSWMFCLTLFMGMQSYFPFKTAAATTTTTRPTAVMDKCPPLQTPFLKTHVFGKDPFNLFTEWKDQADDCGMPGVVMTLATASKDGIPSVRHVILVGEVTEGFVFFSHYDSLKGRQLEENPVASAMFYYNHDRPTDRQVVLTGNVTKITKLQSDTYWNSVSMNYKLLNYLKQGRQVRSRKVMTTMRQESFNKYQTVPMERPPTWGGYIIRPYVIQFSQGAGDVRDRIVFKKLRPDEVFDPVTMERGVNGWIYYRILP